MPKLFPYIFSVYVISFLVPVAATASEQTDTTRLVKEDSLLPIMRYIRVDSTGWVNVSDRIIFGCETGTYNTWYTFKNINDNHPDSLYDYNDWMFKSGYSPLSNSYYLATQYGKFSFYSHRILPNSAISGRSSTKYVSYGYGHMFRNINVGISYKNIAGFRRTNYFDYDYINVDDTLKSLSVKDYRLTIEFIAKHNMIYKKYGFSSLYFPVKSSVSVNLMMESSLFRLFNNGQSIIPYYWFNYSDGHIYTRDDKYMKSFSIFTQSVNFRASGVFPIIKSKGDRPKSFFFKFDYVYGLNFYRYKNETFDQGTVYSGFRLAMANSAGTLQFVYADRILHISSGIFLRVIKFNELVRKEELSMKFYTYYIFVNAGVRIPFRKGYEKINRIF